jgi:APA family basic amino acid/polyamine antiporter
MQKFSKLTGISVVVANMIGTGVFTSLGFQLLGIQSAV